MWFTVSVQQVQVLFYLQKEMPMSSENLKFDIHEFLKL